MRAGILDVRKWLDQTDNASDILDWWEAVDRIDPIDCGSSWMQSATIAHQLALIRHSIYCYMSPSNMPPYPKWHDHMPPHTVWDEEATTKPSTTPLTAEQCDVLFDRIARSHAAKSATPPMSFTF